MWRYVAVQARRRVQFINAQPQTAQAVNASTPVSTAIHDIYLEAITKGYGSDNITNAEIEQSDP